jgi:polysaccharide deacetylase family protein (PEP-CTERM system associated)
LPPASSHQPPAAEKVRCTFFTLGWLAERLPHLVREITNRGHEVASHGTSHRMCNQLSEADLRNELDGSKHLLEDITGTEVSGFRAPNFSVSDRVISILQGSGYRYDSSYNNFALHGRYGKISLNGQPKAGVAFKLADGFFELPISNLSLLSFLALGNLATRNFSHFYLPWSGGAYFRLMPVSIFTRGVRAIIQNTGAYVFYMHPWEVDPGQPRFKQASLNSKLKHYTNLGTTHAKLCRLVGEFADCSFQSCKEYLELQIGSRSAVTDRMDG